MTDREIRNAKAAWAELRVEIRERALRGTPSRMVFPVYWPVGK